MPSSDDFKETVRQQADIVRIIGEYVRLRKSGAQNYSGLCPFHSEKTPSFSVHATRQFFHCFGCGESGDVFKFVQKVEGLSFPEALRSLAQKLGIPLPKVSYSSPAEERDAKIRRSLLDAHEQAVTFFQECLKRPEGARAREYLLTRGLDEETIVRFRIGFAPDSGFLLRDRLKGQFPEEVLRESGLFSFKQTEGAPSLSVRSLDGQGGDFDSGPEPNAQSAKPAAGSGPSPANDRFEPALSGAKGPTTAAMYSKFRNRVMFPISNDAGKVIAFTGRTLASDEKSGPKYLNSPETSIYSKSRVLFNLDQAKEALRKLDYAILVEGQMDCISVYAAGLHNVIASSGTAFTELQAKLLSRYTKNVVVNFDPDTAGARATERTLGLLVEEDFQIKVLTLEQGFDPDLFIRQKGKDAYAEALRGSQRYFDYLIDRARAQFPARSAESKVKAVNYLLPHVQKIPSRIVRDELAHEIAQKLGIDSSVLRQELKHVAGARSAAAVKAPANVQITDAERILIRALCAARQMQAGEAHISARDGAEEDFDPARQARFALESEALHRGLASESLIEALLSSAIESAGLMDAPQSESDRRLLATILMGDEEDLTAERVDGAARALQRIHIRRRLEQAQRELAKPGVSNDRVRMKELLVELERLKRALREPGLAEGGNAA